MTAFVVMWVCLLGLCHGEATPETFDSSFCHGGLKVIYPQVAIDKCLVIPVELREKISTNRKAPEIYFPQALKKNVYILVMVDPDAPSYTNPSSAHWRHWLVANIQGEGLQNGQINGTTLTDYARPTPPKGSGFHRYQFMLFEQAANTVTLTQQEKSSPGNWNLPAFLARFQLRKAVASVQFLTKNYRD